MATRRGSSGPVSMFCGGPVPSQRRPVNLGGAQPARLGHAFERKARDELEAAGFWVTATPPANDGGVDLVAIKHARVMAVQCKRDGYLDPAGREALYSLRWNWGIFPVLASRNDVDGKVLWRYLHDPAAPPARAWQTFKLSDFGDWE